MGDKSYIRTDKGYIFYDLSSRQKSGLKLLGKQYGSIVKHSKNITDLIELGDYVNGYRIDNIINSVLVHRANGLDRSGCLIPIAQYESDIKLIVTKEQFEENCYRLEDN